MTQATPSTDQAPSSPGAREKQAARPFLGYVHGFRSLAIVAVVATHVASGPLGWTPRGPFVTRLVQALILNGTVPFVLVAGFLFQYLSARFRYPRYLLTKFTNVILPYLIVSLPTLALQFIRRNGVFAAVPHEHPIDALPPLIGAVMTGRHMATPLWFIPVIAVFYLAAPLFIAIDRRPRLYWIILPLLALAMLIHRPLEHKLVWQSAVYCLPVYMAGCWASHHREPLLQWLSRHRTLVGGVFITLIAVELFVLKRSGAVFSARPFSIERGVLDIDLPAKVLASLFALELLYRRQERLPVWMFHVAGASFGMFFVHEYIIDALTAMGRRTHLDLEGHGMLLFLPLTAFVAATSYLITELTKRIFGHRSRMIIGS